MSKLFRYFKPFIGSILCIVILLFGQAYCELNLPDTMQNIVNVGIQNQGITSGVYQKVSEKTMQGYLFLADSDVKEEILDAYTLVEPTNATSKQIDEVPALEKEPVYFLDTDLSKEKLDQLDQDLTQLQMTFAMVMQAMQKEGLSQEQLVPFLRQNGMETFKEQAHAQIESLGESTIATMSAQFVSAEYENLGMDMAHLQQNYILQSGLIMLAYALSSGICAIFVGYFASRVAAGVSYHLRNDVFQKVTYFSNENFGTFNTGTLITRTTNDIQQIQMAIIMILRIVIYAPIIGIGALLHVLQSEAGMTWIIALCVVVILSIVASMFAVVMPKFKKMQKFTDKLNSVVQELLDGILVIRAFNNETVEQEKFEKANLDITKVSLFTTRAMALLMPLMMFLMNGTTLLILWVGAGQVDSGMIQVGSIMAFMQYAMQVIMAFLMITMIAIMIPRANVSALRVYEVLQTKNTISEPEQAMNFDTAKRGEVEFDHVSFRYPGADEDVLTDISFTAHPGEVTAFIGSTGSGKSTLVNLVPRFYDVSSGSIRVDGVDIRKVNASNLRDRIGYVPQKGVLLAGTIESNLKYAKPDADSLEIDEALAIAQAKEFVDIKPKGIKEPIAQQGTNVSGGQKQRLSIARALIRKPEIYIFDDSFSALDYKTDAKLRQQLHTSIQDTKSTVLLVAQRVSTILHANQIIVLDEGKMVGKGTHEELMKTCSVYQEIVLSQMNGKELENA
ncbi:ABC transporter ATP-binding protein [Faecalicoccus pleomorphus]|uniref:ABC transporter ATP-binding protein n=1 Tax=Faecalicoccus pleomorphus TaxID=1323 RepID=UPI0023314399|nr:ABC transporter ATP-binding protein [Faecalicoccus pleomorphus]MDB7985906.1 ABC transporter ATP-binding protein [Faecalicoccus pleomorphus]MDB7991673.1 ABC transporter ATP-binding protein [Faecalicoccus pleomorphus]